MFSESILTHLCAARFREGDVAHLVAWADGQFGIVRNGLPVGQQRWDRGDISDCAKAFLNYVRIVRRQVSGPGGGARDPRAA